MFLGEHLPQIGEQVEKGGLNKFVFLTKNITFFILHCYDQVTIFTAVKSTVSSAHERYHAVYTISTIIP